MADNSELKSKGHVMYFYNDELFVTESGELFRAPRNRDLDADGYRMGARWEAPVHMVAEFVKMYSEHAHQPQLL